MRPKPVLGLFDVTNLVIGSTIGADIYVVASLGAAALGPAVLIAWVIGGLLAAVIAQSFAQASVIIPKAGGPYAYVRAAYGDFPAFIVGWALYVGEWVSVAIFPIAFVRYLGYFFPDLPLLWIIFIKLAFVAFITGSNIVGTRFSGEVNDALTLTKLAPLLVLVLAGLVAVSIGAVIPRDNLIPFAPFGWGGFSTAFTPVFWAYAGFEMATLPTSEIRDPQHTMPRAFFRGMAVVTLFYLLVNLVVVVAVPTDVIASSQTPLVLGLGTILQALGLPVLFGQVLMAVGALFSIAGVNESFTLGSSRLSYAMAVDGLFPRFFAVLHPRFGTPYLGLIFLGATTAIVALIGDLASLITISVFGLSVVYIATGLSATKLVRQHPEECLHIPGAMFLPIVSVAASTFLFFTTGPTAFFWGTLFILVGLPLFFFFAPKETAEKERQEFLSRARSLERVADTSGLYLAGLVQIVTRGIKTLNNRNSRR